MAIGAVRHPGSYAHAPMDACSLLRPGLLAGRTIALGGGDALAAPLAALGARTPPLLPTLDEDVAAADVRGVLATHGEIDVLLHDLRPAFDGGGNDGLRVALDRAWIAVRAVAVAAFIAGERGGRVVLVAPSPDDCDPAASAVRAAAENLARTLSIEWARHRIATVAIAPGATTRDDELAALTAYLASPAGAYFSGCRLELGAVA
jgi:NAD(P)-dependent dehydrogenase (short-subunit alcohol dehydrogenase family)